MTAGNKRARRGSAAAQSLRKAEYFQAQEFGTLTAMGWIASTERLRRQLTGARGSEHAACKQAPARRVFTGA